MVNKIIMQGRLTAKPEVKDVGGFNMCEFTVAWSEKFKEKENKCFLKCKAWQTTADFLGKYFEKGQEIAIEGRMLTESWERDGKPQSRIVCDVEKVNFCGSKSSNGGSVQTKQNDDFMKIADTDKEELPFN